MNEKQHYEAWNQFGLVVRPLQEPIVTPDGAAYHYCAEPRWRHDPELQSVIAGAQKRAINDIFGQDTVGTIKLTFEGTTARCIIMPEGTVPVKKGGVDLSADEMEQFKYTMKYIPEAAAKNRQLDAQGVYEKAQEEARETNSVRLTGVTTAAEPVFLTAEQADFEANLMLLKARMEVEELIRKEHDKS